MANIKCKICKKSFKNGDDIMVVDGQYTSAVHDACHYSYLANMHMNNLVTFDELKEEIKNK